MKFTNRKGNTGTIRKVWNDDKSICYGLVGTVGDFLEVKILTYTDYSLKTWAFIPGPDSKEKIWFGATKEEALANLPK